MQTIEQMLETYPNEIGEVDADKLSQTIHTLIECAQACTACADACLGEDSVANLTTCIRSNLDCADVCSTTANVLTRHTGYDATVTRTQLEACVAACKSCGDECARHAETHEHCRICADLCRACEQACRDLQANLG